MQTNQERIVYHEWERMMLLQLVGWWICLCGTWFTCMRMPSVSLPFWSKFVHSFVPFCAFASLWVLLCVSDGFAMHVIANVTECCFPLANYSHHRSSPMYLSGIFCCICAMRRLCIGNRCHTNSAFSPEISVPYFIRFVCTSFAYWNVSESNQSNFDGILSTRLFW